MKANKNLSQMPDNKYEDFFCSCLCYIEILLFFFCLIEMLLFFFFLLMKFEGFFFGFEKK